MKTSKAFYEELIKDSVFDDLKRHLAAYLQVLEMTYESYETIYEEQLTAACRHVCEQIADSDFQEIDDKYCIALEILSDKAMMNCLMSSDDDVDYSGVIEKMMWGIPEETIDMPCLENEETIIAAIDMIVEFLHNDDDYYRPWL